MNNFEKEFASFDGRIWLNAASEGPLPLVSARALADAIEWKSKPYQLSIPKFVSTQKGLKESIGRLIGVPHRDVILANSASYGLHILANGIQWKRGDEIILMHNDFPADILPWLALEEKGVVIRQVKARKQVMQPSELLENITDQTRLFCISHVHTFTGIVLDIKRFSEICKEKEVIFVLNITQSVGTMPIDLSQFSIDAVVSAGYKWLCGPYGTGFCWIKPELRDQLSLNRAYWPAILSEEDLKSEDVLTARDIKTARKYDIFGTANFFNFVPFKAAIDFFLEVGLEHVRAYHDSLIELFLSQLNSDQYDLISPREGSQRSSLVFFSHRDRNRNEQIFKDLTRQGIHTAFWKGNLRVAPHIYNTEEQMHKVAQVLKEFQ